MLPFFRKIRYQLAKENQFLKYSRYAIGEIVLVVIGILIALQINNWKQEIESRTIEQNYLSELKFNLISDSTAIHETLTFNEKKTAMVLEFMKIFDAELTNDQRFDIFETYSKPFTAYSVFKPKMTTWNNLLSSEKVSILKNVNLRNQLIDYYSYDYSGGVQERIVIMNRKIIDENYQKFVTKQYVQKNFGMSTQFSDISNLSIHIDQEFFSNLYGISYIIILQNTFLEELLQDIRTMLILIDERLDN
ncbi:DUF6090 family protein [Lutimonas sp.]|uniref:DUF6090 family protein n=1 Tax=Lutimonas sp. TaxID=1872403 RepID=UPI003D9BE06C